jgi:tRNA pseudouridine38-40 synthase
VLQRYFLYFAYNGSAFHGWQIQPNGISVQEVLTQALCTVLRTEIEIVGAGRTDTGVHAKLMVAHFDADVELISSIDLINKLNSVLPRDIAAFDLKLVKPDAHARFDATSRKYEYHVVLNKNVFTYQLAARFMGEVDFEKMNEAASRLLKYNDFTSFSKLHTDVKTNICKVTHARWEKRDKIWVFTIVADRFLRNMVRAIVGTLIEVGKGKLTVEQFCAIIEAKDRCKAGTSVAACGLYLVDVTYPDEIFI